MINDALKMTGHLAISINNEVVCEVPNLVVLDGKEFVASRMKDTTKAANSITYVATFSAGEGTGAITEAGLFNASSAGDMLCRTVFPVINKGVNDSCTITWSVTVS